MEAAAFYFGTYPGHYSGNYMLNSGSCYCSISLQFSGDSNLGYDPEVLCSDDVAIIDFIHPEDQMIMR